MSIKKLWPAALPAVVAFVLLAACGDDPAGPDPIDPEFIAAVCNVLK